MPTVLTLRSATAIEEELLVAFRAGDGAFHNLRFEPQLFGRCLYFRARGFVLRGIADDTAFSNLSFTSFKLRLYQDNNMPLIPACFSILSSLRAGSRLPR